MVSKTNRETDIVEWAPTEMMMPLPSSGIHRFGGGGGGGGCKLLVAFKRPKKEGETGGFTPTSISQSKLPYTGMVLRDDFLHDKVCNKPLPWYFVTSPIKSSPIRPALHEYSYYYLVPWLLHPRFYYVAILNIPGLLVSEYMQCNLEQSSSLCFVKSSLMFRGRLLFFYCPEILEKVCEKMSAVWLLLYLAFTCKVKKTISFTIIHLHEIVNISWDLAEWLYRASDFQCILS